MTSDKIRGLKDGFFAGLAFNAFTGGSIQYFIELCRFGRDVKPLRNLFD